MTPKSKKTRDMVPPRGAPLSRRSAEAMLNELKSRLLEISDLVAAGSLLNWDQATYMPRGGAPARSRQSATLNRLAHQQLVELGDRPVARRARALC